MRLAVTARAFHIASDTVRPNPSARDFCTTWRALRWSALTIAAFSSMSSIGSRARWIRRRSAGARPGHERLRLGRAPPRPRDRRIRPPPPDRRRRGGPRCLARCARRSRRSRRADLQVPFPAGDLKRVVVLVAQGRTSMGGARRATSRRSVHAREARRARRRPGPSAGRWPARIADAVGSSMISFFSGFTSRSTVG